MRIYRLEHSISALGPYEHSNSKGVKSAIVLKLGTHEDPIKFTEFTAWRDDNELGSGQLPKQYVFGWSSKTLYNQFIKKNVAFKYGFKLSIYIAESLLTLPDGQVIFDRSQSVKIH